MSEVTLDLGSEPADKEKLFVRRLPEDDVTVPGVGKFHVRGLSRAEVLVARQGRKEGDTAGLERAMLAFGMVSPEMTQAEVGRWQEASIAGEMEPIVNRIAELSGMKPSAEKDAYKRTRSESSTGVRVLSGTEAGEDGGGTSEDAVG